MARQKIEDWKKIDSHEVVDCRILRVRRDRSRSPRTGAVNEFHILEMPDWINVVPVTAKGNVVLIRQFRHGMEETKLEIPGGAVEAHEADPAEAAHRELLEETGYAAETLLPLGSVAPNPAIQNNRCSSFLALNAAPAGGQRLDDGEDIEVVEVPLDSIPELIRDGTINHGLVVVAFYLLERYLEANPVSVLEPEKQPEK